MLTTKVRSQATKTIQVLTRSTGRYSEETMRGCPPISVFLLLGSSIWGSKCSPFNKNQSLIRMRARWEMAKAIMAASRI